MHFFLYNKTDACPLPSDVHGIYFDVFQLPRHATLWHWPLTFWPC